MKPLSECFLYAFVDTAYLHGRDPVWLAEQLCKGGADLVQLRAKDWPADKVAEVGSEIIKVTRKYEVRLVVNDFLDIAHQIGAEMCHLGQEDFFQSGYKHVSELSGRGKNLKIGLSTHAPAQAARAIAAGPAYVAIGPVFRTLTKPSAPPVTLDYVRWAAENVRVPWFAIGGINRLNLAEVISAGARSVCVVSAILEQPDVARACQEFKSVLELSPRRPAQSFCG